MRAKILDKQIRDFKGVSVLMINSLGRNDIRTVEDLVEMSEKLLKKCRGVGVTTLNEIKMFLKKHNLKLKENA
jgi:DNA-directed RNA polymerase alpha subunit